MKKGLKIGIAAIVAAALVIGGVRLVKAKRAQESKEVPAKVYPVVVQTMVPHKGTAQLTLPYLAEAHNETDVTLSSRIASRVEQIVKSGTAVKKGQVVATLDTTDLTANIEALKVSLNNALKSHARTEALYKVKGASIEQLQKEQSQIASLKAKLKAAENQLSYATIVSPIDGTVAKAMAAAGDVAMPGKPLLQISADTGFSLLVRTPKTITPKAVFFGGKSYALHPLGSTLRGLKEYKAFVNDKRGLSSGERVEVNVVIYDAKDAIMLPFDALLDRDGKSYVLEVQKNHAKAVMVHIVQSGEQGVVVKEKLAGKKIIIAKPDVLLKLTSGYTLKVKE